MTNTNCGYAVCRLIGNLINGKNNTDKAELPSLSDMADFAKKHNLLTMLYPALIHCGYTEAELSEIAEKADAESFYQIKTDAFALRLSELFSKSQIEHMILKGIEYQKYYPPSLIRKTSDIDFYITPEYSERAEQIIDSLGFEKISSGDSTSAFSKKPCYHIEVHKYFSFDNEAHTQVFNEILSNSINNGGYRKSLSNTGNLIYALLHLYKHISTSGAGARMFLDIYLIQKKADAYDSELSAIIKRLGLQKFYACVSNIAGFLFEGAELDEDLKNAVEFIFSSGTFGSQAFFRRLSVSRIEGSHRRKVFRHFSDEFGFSTENIKRKYPTAKKHPVSIPYFQVHRVIHGLIHKKSVAADAGSQYKAFKDKKSVNDISKIMESLGININKTKQ